MKRHFILTLAIILLAASYASAQAKKTVEPTAKEALRLILANGDIPLTINATCKDVGASRDDKTIFDYLTGLLSFQTEPDSASHIEFKYKAEKNKRDEALWICDLMFYGKDGDDEWSWGVRFAMRDSNRKLIRSSVVCTGSG
jgi:hypothetical protein